MKLIQIKDFGEIENAEEISSLINIMQKEKESWKGFSAHLIEAENPRKFYAKISAHLGLEAPGKEEAKVHEELAGRLAVFLFQDYHLPSDHVYKVLGGAEPLSKIALDKFLGLFNFYDQSVEEALRVFFLMFLMKGESQMVERVLSGLSTRFFNHNSINKQNSKFASDDIVFPYIYSLIMLNTDLHTSKNTGNKKMSLDEFRVNTRRVLGKSDVSEEELETIYRNIEKKELKALDQRELTTEKTIDKRTWAFYCKISRENDMSLASCLSPEGSNAFQKATKMAGQFMMIGLGKFFYGQIIQNLTSLINQMYKKPFPEVEEALERIVLWSVQMNSNLECGSHNLLLSQIYKNLELENQFGSLLKDEKLMFRVICFFIVVKKFFVFRQTSLRLLIKVLLETFSFQKNVLKSKIVVENTEFYAKMKRASVSLNRMYHEKASIFSIFSGYVDQEIADLEYISPKKQSSNDFTKAELEAQSNFLKSFGENKPNQIVEEILEESQSMSDENAELFIHNLIDEILELNLTEMNAEVAAHFMLLGLEFVLRQHKRIHLVWPHFCNFIYKTFIEKNDSSSQTASFKASLSSNPAVKGALVAVASSCLFRACIILMDSVCMEPNIEKYLRESIKELEAFSVEALEDHISILNQLVISMSSNQKNNQKKPVKELNQKSDLQMWKMVILVCEKFLRIIESKNLDHKDVVVVCERFHEVITNAFLRISYFSELEIPEITGVWLDFHSKYVSSMVTKKLNLSEKIIENYFSFVTSLHEFLSQKNSSQRCNAFVITFLEHITNFLVMSVSVNLMMALKIVQNLCLKLRLDSDSSSLGLKAFELLLICYGRLSKSSDQDIHMSYFETVSKLFLTSLECFKNGPNFSQAWLKYLENCISVYNLAQTRRYNFLIENVEENMKNNVAIMLDFQLVYWIPNKVQSEKEIEYAVERFSKQIEVWSQSLSFVEKRSALFAKLMSRISSELAPMQVRL